MTKLARITIYPIKSLDGKQVNESEVAPPGWLADDRRFAIIDAEDNFLNGKRTPAIHRIHATWNDGDLGFSLAINGGPAEPFDSTPDDDRPTTWLINALGQSCRVIENRQGGFPDDTDAPGPTLISTQSLKAIADWFDLEIEETRRRLRANLEIDAPYAFWEDQLVGRDFTIGDVTLHASGVCQRCVVPTRDSRSGEATPGFQKRFSRQREATLPATSPRQVFNHYYRTAINTRLAGSGGMLRVGDDLR